MKREMKDSGIKWIGEIPREWRICRVKDVIKGLQDGTHGTFNRVESNYLLLSAKNIMDNGVLVSESESSISKEDYLNIISNGYPQNGDIALCCVGTIGRCCIYNEDKIHAFQRSVSFLRVNERILNLYLLYYLRSNLSFYQYDTLSKASAQSGIYLGTLSNLIIILPPLPEQRRIATFLDHQCSEIDKLISLQEQFIEELKAYKQSVITEAVTKGLNPGVEMKESGVEWIDTIPSHWEKRKLKTLVTLKSGTNLTSYDINETNGYPVYGGNGLRGYYSEYSNEGDYILIGRQGALCGNVNYTHGKFWVTEHALVCYPKCEYIVNWLGELLRAMNLNQYSLSAAQPGLSAERIMNLYLPVPPLSEQRSIATYLDTKCTEIDSLIALKQQKIESLNAYKKSMIYEYVTGKKSVPDA